MFSWLNSLVGLLILILIIAVLVVVIRAVMSSAGGTRRTEERVVQQPVVQQPAPTSGLAPGWYPDQSDPSLVRYYDGRVWTAQTQPR